jgi:DNA-binding XRE family transcriptional regulator
MSQVRDQQVEHVTPHTKQKSSLGSRATMLAKRPPDFERLQRFFASQSAFARALGVHRDTIRSWERGHPTRLRSSSVTRVRAVCAVAEEVARYLPRDDLVGKWMLAPQIALGGYSAAALIQRQPGAYRRVLGLIAREARPVSVGDVSDLVEANEHDTPNPRPPVPASDPDADPDFLASLG